MSPLEPAASHSGPPQRHDLDGTGWWHVAAPTAETLATLGRDLGLPPAVLDAVGDAAPRPHRLRCDGWKVWVLAPVAFRPAAAQVVVGHLVVATDGALVVTCGAIPEATSEEFVTGVARRHAGPRGADGVVDAIVAEVLDRAGEAVGELDDAIEDIEEAVFAPQRGSHAERIYRLKREAHVVRRCVGPLPELVGPAPTGDADPSVDTDIGVAIPVLHAQALRLVDQVAHGDALLDSVLAAHQAQVTIQQNDDMRRISAWVAIVAAPTAIASIYGMNFRHMPELGAPLGYPAALLVMLVVCLTLYRLFRRSGWL